MPQNNILTGIAGLSIALTLLFGIWDCAIAQNEESYFCETEAVGGLSYDATDKKWKGTSFNDRNKFALRVQIIEPSNTKERKAYDNFRVTITPYGESKGSDCTNLNAWGKIRFFLNDNLASYIWCDIGGIVDFAFNSQTNRFLKIYPVGFLDGKESNDNTPYIAGGTCTKLN
jgi:hypothetical protein